MRREYETVLSMNYYGQFRTSVIEEFSEHRWSVNPIWGIRLMVWNFWAPHNVWKTDYSFRPFSINILTLRRFKDIVVLLVTNEGSVNHH